MNENDLNVSQLLKTAYFFRGIHNVQSIKDNNLWICARRCNIFVAVSIVLECGYKYDSR